MTIEHRRAIEQAIWTAAIHAAGDAAARIEQDGMTHREWIERGKPRGPIEMSIREMLQMRPPQSELLGCPLQRGER